MGGGEVQVVIYSFLTAALDGVKQSPVPLKGGWLALGPICRFLEMRKIFNLLRIEPRFLDRATRILVTIITMLEQANKMRLEINEKKTKFMTVSRNPTTRMKM
jgi:hypothetical protein